MQHDKLVNALRDLQTESEKAQSLKSEDSNIVLSDGDDKILEAPHSSKEEKNKGIITSGYGNIPDKIVLQLER